jgi:hypothetical protein
VGTGSFPGVKQPGRGADHPPPSKCRGHERVGLYLYSPSDPQLPVIGRAFTFTLHYSAYNEKREYLYLFLPKALHEPPNTLLTYAQSFFNINSSTYYSQNFWGFHVILKIHSDYFCTYSEQTTVINIQIINILLEEEKKKDFQVSLDW